MGSGALVLVWSHPTCASQSIPISPPLSESVRIAPQLNILNHLAFDSPRYLGAAPAVAFLHHFPGGHPSKHNSRPSTLNCPVFGLARISQGSRPAFGRITPVRGARPGSRLAQGPLAVPVRQQRHAWAPRQRTAAGSQAHGGEEHAKGAEFVFTSPEEAVRQRKGLPEALLRSEARAWELAPASRRRKTVVGGRREGGAKRGATRGLPRRSPILVLLSPKHA